VRTIQKLSLSSIQYNALQELKEQIIKRFEVVQLILFGSVARGEADDESDLDLLVITKKLYTRIERHGITNMVFEINLKYGTNISTTVVDYNSWENGVFSVLPIKHEIQREGIVI